MGGNYSGDYDIYISETTIFEVMDAKEEKRSIMLENLAKIKHTTLNIDERVIRYAKKLNEIGVLTEKRYDDCLHIGFAVVNGCDMILSWNFSHILTKENIFQETFKFSFVSNLKWCGKVIFFSALSIL